MKIYIDTEFKCHVTNDGTMTAIETEFFEGKCDAYIEGYRFIPFNESWQREDGIIFVGEMAAPWVDYSILAAMQTQYEIDKKEIDEISFETNAAQMAYNEGVNEA